MVGGCLEMSLSGYDCLIERLIPGYASLARLSVSLLAASPRAHPPGTSVLVAGCGSGAELIEARTLRPDWRLTALDPSASMLAIAKKKLLAEEGEASESIQSIHWIQGNVEDLPDVPSFDGAMAVLVLQGLPDDGSKLKFLSSLSRSLHAGSQVVLIDQMQPERNAIQDQLLAARLIFQRTQSPSTAAASEFKDSTEDILGSIHPIGLARLASLLEATGFGDPCSVFKALDYEGFLFQKLQ